MISLPVPKLQTIIGGAIMNRTGTYVAFDGLGQADPTKSDFRYYATLQAATEAVAVTK